MSNKRAYASVDSAWPAASCSVFPRSLPGTQMATFSRAEAFDFAWSAPMIELAAQVGLSDVGLRKALVALDIPLPPQGYWNKVRAGRMVPPRPQLPLRGPGMPYEVELGRPNQQRPFRVDPDDSDPVEPAFEESLEHVEARVTTALRRHIGGRSLDRPHAAIQQILRRDEKRREEAKRSPYGSAPLFDSPFERRRLTFLNSLIFSLGPFVRRAETRGTAAREILITVGVQTVTMWLDHPEARPQRNDYAPTRPGKADRLRLVIGDAWSNGSDVWEDRQNAPLEKQLPKLAPHIVTQAEADLRQFAQLKCKWHRERLIAARAEREEARRKAIEAERARIQKETEEARARLIGYARDAQAAREIRTFVASVEAAAKRDPSLAARYATWSAWALSVADGLDPMQRLDDLLSAKPPP